MMKAKLKPLLRACTAFTCATCLIASPVCVYAEDSVSDLETETQNLQSELQDFESAVILYQRRNHFTCFEDRQHE